MTKPTGLTLIEIMTVIAIIGILAIVSFPVYKQISPTLNLNGATRDLVTDLRYAQQLAVTEQNDYTVTFDINLDQYTTTNFNTSEVLSTKTLDANISFDSISADLINNGVRFNVTGAATASGEINLINENLKIKTIEIKPSGYVKVQ